LIAASGPGSDVDGLGEVGALDEVEAGEVQARWDDRSRRNCNVKLDDRRWDRPL
jgi:hypothetical protein